MSIGMFIDKIKCHSRRALKLNVMIIKFKKCLVGKPNLVKCLSCHFDLCIVIVPAPSTKPFNKSCSSLSNILQKSVRIIVMKF